MRPLLLWATAFALACMAALAEPTAPQGAVLAHAAPRTLEEANAALSAYAASEATLLLLTPAPGVAIPPDALSALEKSYYTPESEALHLLGEDALYAINPEPTGAYEAAVQNARRTHRSARWSIGVMRQYTPFENFRLDLVLFRDEPLDYLFVAQSSVLSEQPRARSPFGPTVIIGPLPEAEHPIQLYVLSETGIAPWAPPAPEPPENAEESPAPAAPEE